MKQSTELAMSKPDLLDEIIQQISPENIPHEYIVMAKVRTFDGNEELITGDELEDFIKTQGENIADIRVLLDLKGLRKAIDMETNRIFIEASRF